jgi:hypothetical protein
MSVYRFLAPHYLGVGGGMYINAGSVLSTADVGGILPANWVPSNSVDPIDASAIAAFFAAGVQLWPGCPIGVNGFQIAPPVTYWQSSRPQYNEYALVSAGVVLGWRNLTCR